jgi:hypothetical protein
LELPLWVFDLSGVHGRESLGHDLQQHHLGLSRLWRLEQLRQPVKTVVTIDRVSVDPFGGKEIGSRLSLMGGG